MTSPPPVSSSSSSSLPIYDNEQYLFELAQSFMRSRIIFTCTELKVFDLLLTHENGLTCAEIAHALNLHFIENESRCLQDVLDALTSMDFLVRQQNNGIYKLASMTENVFLRHQNLLVTLDREFYSNMPHCHELKINNCSEQSVQTLMLLRIQQLVDLRHYTKISIDKIDHHADVIIIWRQDGLLRDRIQQAFDILPVNKQGLLIVVVPDDQHDEVTLALNLFVNMMHTDHEQANPSDLYSVQTLKTIGFRTVEEIQSKDGLTLLVAHK
jgi:hypothetical protein